MGVRVVSCSAAEVILGAPLAPNINHRATAFGGSLSAVAILSAWTWLHRAAREAGCHTRLVIQRNSIEYLAPVSTEFEARCTGLDAVVQEKFFRTLHRLGKARATLTAELTSGGQVVATFTGDYVAMLLDEQVTAQQT